LKQQREEEKKMKKGRFAFIDEEKNQSSTKPTTIRVEPTGTFNPQLIHTTKQILLNLNDGHDDVLLLIFSYLHTSEVLKNVACCSKRFNILSKNPVLYQTMTLYSNRLTGLNIQVFIEAFMTMTTELIVIGPLLESVVTIIAELALQLESLCLNHSTTPQNSEQFTELLFSCKNLKILKVNGSYFNPLPHMGMWNKLEQLIMTLPNSLSNDTWSKPTYVVPDDIKSDQAVRIKTIDCWLTGAYVQKVAETFPNIESLSVSETSAHYLSIPSLKHIDEMIYLKHLKIHEFAISYHITPFNYIKSIETMLESLSLSISSPEFFTTSQINLDKQRNLQRLELIGITCQILPKLSHCLNLTSLTIKQCQIPDIRLDDICHLKSLTINHCRLIKIPSGVKTMTNLNYLDLSHNLIKSLSDEITGTINLIDLNMEGNPLYSVTPDLTMLLKLRSLNLYVMTDVSHVKLPSTLETLIIIGSGEYGIHYLDAWNIGLMPNLTQLVVEFQKQLRTVPREIGYVQNLEILNLRTCNLETIPEESISYLSNLKQLLLSDNCITSFNLDTSRLKYMELIDLVANPVYIKLSEQYNNVPAVLPEQDINQIITNCLVKWNDYDNSRKKIYAVNYVMSFQFNYVICFLIHHMDRKGSEVFQGIASVNADSFSIKYYDQRSIAVTKSNTIERPYKKQQDLMHLPEYRQLHWNTLK
jgi:Leucine-rich repeat (LRR) protein